MSDAMKRRVSNGITWLDENRPGWLERIDLDALDLGSPCRCILGQEWLHENPDWIEKGFESLAFEEAVEEWNSWNGDPDWDAEMGFELYSRRRADKDYAELTEIWKSEILRLRKERAR